MNKAIVCIKLENLTKNNISIENTRTKVDIKQIAEDKSLKKQTKS